MNNDNNQENNFDGIVLGEAVENAEAVADVKIPENKGTIKDNTSQDEPKKKKGKFGKFLAFLVVLIALAAGGGYYYLTYMCTVDKFIDYNVDNINSSINNVFNNSIAYNLFEDDYLGNGTLELSTTNNEYAFLNGLKLDYTVEMALNSNYAKVKGDVIQEDAKLSGYAFVDKEDAYINIDEVFPVLIKYNLEENYFETIKKELEETKDTSLEDVRQMTNKFISYCGEALKEVQSDVKLDGMYLNYSFHFDNDGYKKFSEKLTSLLKNDEQFKDIFKQAESATSLENEYYDEEETTINNDTDISIKVNPLTKELESFVITNNDKVVNGVKTEKNNYEITYDKTIIKAEVTKNKISINASDDGKDKGSFSVAIDNNKTSLNLKTNYADKEMAMDLVTTKVSNSEIKSDASFNYDGIILKNTLTNKVGSSLVTKETIGNFREYDQLSEDMINYIANNLNNKINEFKVYKDYYSSHV